MIPFNQTIAGCKSVRIGSLRELKEYMHTNDKVPIAVNLNDFMTDTRRTRRREERQAEVAMEGIIDSKIARMRFGREVPVERWRVMRNRPDPWGIKKREIAERSGRIVRRSA